jgi:YggT family protein
MPAFAPQIIASAIFSLCTLYMMAILLRWLGRFLEIDLDTPRLRWIARITDPLIGLFRRILPDMGPFDWSPVAALLSVFILRLLLTGQ